MFRILSGDCVIGTTAFEAGDPPMGVVFGVFLPGALFPSFKETSSPVFGNDQDVKTWVKLSAHTSDEELVRCQSVSLTEINLSNEFAYEVTALGVDGHQYTTLFAHHIRSYEDNFRTS